jgi:hypothetical protein
MLRGTFDESLGGLCGIWHIEALERFLQFGLFPAFFTSSVPFGKNQFFSSCSMLGRCFLKNSGVGKTL